MQKQLIEGDRLFLIAENLAKDFSLFPEQSREGEAVSGLLSDSVIRGEIEALSKIDIDSYIERVLAKAEDQSRIAAPKIIRQLGSVFDEKSVGPYYQAILGLVFPGGETRRVGFMAQDRSKDLGVWMPGHHLEAAKFVEACSTQSIPIVTFMDTPGADAKQEANEQNQAHSISRLIAEMSNVDVPNIGVIYGLGYSGGAIPLASSNTILSLKDAVFSTIQPGALANIVRRLNLSWQECAQYVGLSAYELYGQGNIDGVVDYSPSEKSSSPDNLRLAIVGAISNVEGRVKEFVSENPYILDHYRQSLTRYLNPSKSLLAMQTSASLKLTKNPTEYLNVFGVAYRYLRYLQVRKRIKATSTSQYGRLAALELPAGDLKRRTDLERRQKFLSWIQDPDKVIYNDTLLKAWRNYQDKKQSLNEERGRIKLLIFGEPRQNYETARFEFISSLLAFLYNRWKNEASSNLEVLINYLRNFEDTKLLLKVSDIENPIEVIERICAQDDLREELRERFSYQGRVLLNPEDLENRGEAQLAKQLASELNVAITGSVFSLASKEKGSSIKSNRVFLNERVPQIAGSIDERNEGKDESALNVLDVLLDEELREDIVSECNNLLIFDSVYNQVVANLDDIASEAQSVQSLSKETLARLVGSAIAESKSTSEGPDDNTVLDQFFDWYERLLRMPKASSFFTSVEEWKKANFPHIADALFVVVTHIFQNLVSSYIQSEREDKVYQGRIAPRLIGRRKDFWNRLNIAYSDLLMQKRLVEERRQNPFSYKDIIDKYFDNWEDRFEDLLSTDPCSFPGFRQSIEAALNKEVPPCGIVAGVADFKASKNVKVGVLLSNVSFQAGSFDMASAEKFCKLLVECAEQHIPVVCFISSGGMQTKEGAGALFSMAAVNDRITRFVRDHDLPVIVFGYGDCTGGAQASFVTHPLVQTYYFSGTNMPFAGQIVVPSNLPLKSTLSNYLFLNKGSMQGLVEHPFQEGLDGVLRQIDPTIPLPTERVETVVEKVLSSGVAEFRPVVVAHQNRYTDEELIRPTKRVLIHGRGCTAVKLITAAHEMELEIVLVQSDPDMQSVAVDLLNDRDTVVCIGGNTPDESYLNALSVLNVAENEGTDSLHPGIGFLSENSSFAELIRSHGINFIGPPVSSMETMGNKSNAINTAMSLDVPVVPGSHGILTSVEKAAEVANRIGYPVLIKAVHGGGGKGIQIVEEEAELFELFHRVAAEARSAFGNGDVYIEKYVTSLRHIEVQLLRDTQGSTKVLGIRDCSVQRDKQKVLEESGSTMLPAHLEESVLRSTRKIADQVGYVGAGTVEFIYDLKSEAIYFMEMNTRLQVEHPVTELVSGVEIVGEQFRIASGQSIVDLPEEQKGYAIEVRVTAELIEQDAEGSLNFKPQPGRISDCDFPEQQNIQVISTAGAGKEVSPYYDSLLAQVIVHSDTRENAIVELIDYLERVKLTGISSNIPLLKLILKDKVFREGIYDTGYLMELLERSNIDQLISETVEAAGASESAIGRASIAIEGTNELRVLSPSSAIFYSTPSPSEPDYISVGDRIELQTTLCQLEAMKIFSPLKLGDFNQNSQLYDPTLAYEVTRINIRSGQQVNPGDLLFVIRPVEQ